MSKEVSTLISPPLTSAQDTPAGAGSNMGLYLGLGVFALIAAGGGFYMWSKSKKAGDVAKQKASASSTSADSDKVPLTKDGKAVVGKDGNPVLVDPSKVQAGKPIFGSDGKPLLGSDGKPITPSVGDVKALASDSSSAVSSSDASSSDSSSSTAKSNAFVSGATIDKRNANSDYKAYTQSSPDQQAFSNAIRDLLNLAPEHKKLKKRQKKENERAAAALKDAETYVRGFMKGMNLAPSSTYVGVFGQAISDYMNNPAKVKESAVDKAGYFLTTKEGQVS